jgi:hypothetical protein
MSAILLSCCSHPQQQQRTSAPAPVANVDGYDWELLVGPAQQRIDCVQLASCAASPRVTMHSADRRVDVTFEVVGGYAQVAPRGLPQPDPTYIPHLTRNARPSDLLVEVTPAAKPFPAHVSFVVAPAADCEIGSVCCAGTISYVVVGGDGTSSRGSVVEQHMTIGDLVFRVVGEPLVWSSIERDGT